VFSIVMSHLYVMLFSCGLVNDVIRLRNMKLKIINDMFLKENTEIYLKYVCTEAFTMTTNNGNN